MEAQRPEAPPRGPERSEDAGQLRSGEVWATIRAVVLAVMLALLIRQFAIETYRVDGHSMEPTLQNNERLLVMKFIYRVFRPQPGQIIVFLPPLPGARQDFVKRVIAVGGQTVGMRDGVVYVDGQAQAEPWLPTSYRGDKSFGPVTVPQGDVWVLGDHRDDSTDSRVFGPVPLSAIRGEAALIWWPIPDFRRLPAS